MKRGLLLLMAAVAFAFSTTAQSLEVVKFDTVTYVNSTMVKDYGSKVLLKNTTSLDLDIKCKRIVYDAGLCAFDSTYFCWDFCYNSSVNKSVGSMPIDAGITDETTFSGHFWSSDQGGSCVDSVRYTFFVDVDPDDSVSVMMKVMSSPTIGVEENTLAVSRAYPNPASNVFKIELSEMPAANTMVEMYSLLGTKVLSKQVTSSMVELNVSDLSSGIYLYTISTDGQPLETRKVVVKN